MRRHLTNEVRHGILDDDQMDEMIEKESLLSEETPVGKFLDHLFILAEKVPEREQQLNELIEDIEEKINGYVQRRIEYARAARKARTGRYDPAAYRELMEEVDRSRMLAHNALLDSIQIAIRNVRQALEESEIESAPLPAETHFLVDTHEAGYRERVGSAAIDYVWAVLEDEERENRRKVAAASINPQTKGWV